MSMPASRTGDPTTRPLVFAKLAKSEVLVEKIDSDLLKKKITLLEAAQEHFEVGPALVEFFVLGDQRHVVRAAVFLEHDDVELDRDAVELGDHVRAQRAAAGEGDLLPRDLPDHAHVEEEVVGEHVERDVVDAFAHAVREDRPAVLVFEGDVAAVDGEAPPAVVQPPDAIRGRRARARRETKGEDRGRRAHRRIALRVPGCGAFGGWSGFGRTPRLISFV
jgi:hypothetical protein